MIKKFLLSLWLLWFACLAFSGRTNAQSIDDYTVNLYDSQHDTITNDNIWISVIWTNEDQNGSLIDVIKRAVNRVLWMLSLIALILCLWWGFQMITAGWKDDKVKAWAKVLKNAAIWLAVIWLSWFIVSIIFWLIRWVTT
jgi:hypothetical protein